MHNDSFQTAKICRNIRFFYFSAKWQSWETSKSTFPDKGKRTHLQSYYSSPGAEENAWGVKIPGRTLKERSVHHAVISPQPQVAGVSSKPDEPVSSSLWSNLKSTVKLLVIFLRTKSLASVKSVKALGDSPALKPKLGRDTLRGEQAKSGPLKRKVNGLLQQLVKTAVNKLAIAEGRDMSLAGEVANCPVAVVVQELAQLPDA